MRKSIRIMLIFYIMETLITIILLYWLVYLSNEAGAIKISAKIGVVGTFFALGILAYTFGLRHAFDADHLAAIDNSTRKLVQENKSSNFTGLFFSLGHSSVVILLSVTLIVAVRTIASNLPSLESTGTIIGTLVSGGFLYIIGLLNFFIFVTIYKLYKSAKEGKMDEKSLNDALLKRGFMGRYFNRLFKIVDKQYYMYLIGFLFGLGFDTASETALLAITAGAAGVFLKIPFWTLLVFPLLFTAGMTLVDTSDGFFMNGAYTWAFLGHPIKKIWYNLTMTIVSITISFMVGTLELLGLIQREFNLSGSFWGGIELISSGTGWGFIGIIIVITFLVTWITSYIIFKLRVERGIVPNSV
ncbi:MAG: HoxN/HupN/NixA family nickel/cobalt transporter [Nitrososphaeria archaeon]